VTGSGGATSDLERVSRGGPCDYAQGDKVFGAGWRERCETGAFAQGDI
jgi:hypothetical protein